MLYNSPLWIKYLVAIFVSPAISYALTPVAKLIAVKTNAIDVPKDNRRLHDHPIPRMGGLAIYGAFMICVLLLVRPTYQIKGILQGATVIVIAGAIDDRFNLNPLIKLMAQFLAAGIAIKHWVYIDALTNFALGQTVYVRAIAVPITFVWIVLCTNAVNLIDGLDGLAASVCSISFITMAVVALILSNTNIAIILLVLGCGCLGFLPYNFNPAKIFMGDSGSQFLGFTFATVSILGLFKLYAAVTLVVPALALAVPIFDTTFAFARRILNKENPFKADRKHIHHKLIDAGLSQRQAVYVMDSISGSAGLFAVVLAAKKLWVTVLWIAFTVALNSIVFRKIIIQVKNKRKEKPNE